MFPQFSASQLNICAWLMIALAITSLISAFFLTTPYGRYSRRTWGFGIPARIAWLLQECPSFLIPAGMYMASNGPRKFLTLEIEANDVLILLFSLHYLRRSFIYPFWIRKTAPTPFLIFLFAFLFCTINGYIQAQYHINIGIYRQSWFYSLPFVSGCIIFILGFLINVCYDYAVTHLREPGDTRHRIPYGGLFEYISCPNFFGEIVEWAGFALASSSFVAFAFFFNTIFQIGTRACHHHQFYQEKFDDYPKNRKAIIPFLW